MRETEHQVHVMFNHQYGQVFGQGIQGLQHHLTLGRGHTRHGFIEQQHLGLQGHRDGHFDQALLPIRQGHRGLLRQVGQAQGVQDV